MVNVHVDAIRVTVRELKRVLADLDDDVVLTVSKWPHPSRVDWRIAIGNARVAFARFAQRCVFCGRSLDTRVEIGVDHPHDAKRRQWYCVHLRRDGREVRSSL